MNKYRISQPAAFMALFAAVLFMHGCSRDKGTDRFQPVYDKFGEVALAGKRTGGATYAFDGFSARWSKSQSRLNKLAAGMLLISNDTDAGRVSAMGRLALRGDANAEPGSFSYEIGYSLVRSGNAHFFHGETADIEIRRGAGDLNVSLDLRALGLPTCRKDRIAVLLRGFYFDTSKSRKNGYPVRRIAVEIKDPSMDSQGRLSFTAHMEMRTDKQSLFNSKARGDLIMGKLFYTIVAAPQGAVTALDHEHDLKGAEQAPESERTVRIPGKRGAFPAAFAGTQAFSLDWGKRPFPVRGVTFTNRDFTYDPESGRMTFVCDAFMDNSARGTLIKNRRFKNRGRAAARFVLVQLEDNRARVTHRAFQGASRSEFVEHSALSFTKTFSFSSP